VWEARNGGEKNQGLREKGNRNAAHVHHLRKVPTKRRSIADPKSAEGESTRRVQKNKKKGKTDQEKNCRRFASNRRLMGGGTEMSAFNGNAQKERGSVGVAARSSDRPVKSRPRENSENLHVVLGGGVRLPKNKERRIGACKKFWGRTKKLLVKHLQRPLGNNFSRKRKRSDGSLPGGYNGLET